MICMEWMGSRVITNPRLVMTRGGVSKRIVNECKEQKTTLKVEIVSGKRSYRAGGSFDAPPPCR